MPSNNLDRKGMAPGSAFSYCLSFRLLCFKSFSGKNIDSFICNSYRNGAFFSLPKKIGWKFARKVVLD